MAVIGTAGHVDHGKSTLVRALTGRDPDRWREEKERGLTIDLGFAWSVLPDGRPVSFVDVPGHERFMKNMLAGIETIDVALLVVAADEGWMPQSEEHLAVLDLLGVDRGVVALTKQDRVDPDLVDLARLEVEERVGGTSVSGAPIVAVSAQTGEGLGELVAALAAAVDTLPPAPVGRPRLWIDRSFSVPGAGTVVTGTLAGGSVKVGDRMMLFPGEREVRIRSLQTHETEVERVEPRNRAALGLTGVERSEVERGSMLGPPGGFTASGRFTATVKPARYLDELTDRGAYHVHVGSGAWPARVRMMDDALALIELPEALPLVHGDRFILRESGRRLVVGGGVVIDLHPPRRVTAIRQTALAVREAQGPDEVAARLLAARGSYPVDRLAAETGGGRVSAPVVDGVVFHPREIERLAAEARHRVIGFQAQNPLRPGMPTARLAGELGIGQGTLTIVCSEAGLVVESSHAHTADHLVGLTEAQEAAWGEAGRLLEMAGVGALPRIPELGLDPEVIHTLVREGKLVKVSDDFVFLPAQIEAIVESLGRLEQPFTVSEFKDATGMSRKYAVPFLEWADGRGGLTVRMGDRRRLRQGVSRPEPR